MIRNQDACEVCKQYYVDYAIYVYKTRALPSLIDGMKHVQRRTMIQGSNLPQNKYSKSSKLVGDTVPYHPHDPSSIYGAAVSMTTPNNKFKQFVKKGNFGGYGYGPAAMRYTELYLSDYARYGYTQFLPYADIEVGESGLDEPTTLPALIPYCSVVGSSGIGVGMSSSILPLNFMELIDYYIATIKGDTDVKLPKPDFGGGLLVDMTNEEIQENVQKPKSRFAIKSIITQESSSTLVITALNNRTIQSVLNKLQGRFLSTGKVDFRDESSKTLRLVFEIVDNSVPIVELKKALERATTGHNSFDRLLVDDEGRAVHSSLSYQVTKSLAYLNHVLDRKFATELAQLQDRESTLSAIEFIRTSGLVAELPKLTVDEYVQKIVDGGGFSIKHAKLASQKPSTYLTLSHIPELENVRKSIKDIQGIDRTEYLLNLYTTYKKMLRPLYNEYGHTVLRSELLLNPKVKLKKNTLVIASRGKPFNGSILMATKDGYLYPRNLGASIKSEIAVPDELTNKVVDIATDAFKHVILLTNNAGLLVVKYESIRYAKQVIKLDKGEYVQEVIQPKPDGSFMYDGIEYDPTPYVRSKISKPHRNWRL